MKLTARAFDLLLVLVERPGRVISKHELIESVWRDLVVEENNLQVQIMALRRVLGPHAIATVPGRGYRFDLPVQDTSAGAGAAATETPANAAHLPAGLIGRDADIAAAEALIERASLVSIVGPSGIGKTRLALALAQRLRWRFDAQVFVAELASVSDPELVPLTIARAAGLALLPHGPAVEALASQLRGRRMLLVLDNCEHLLPSVGGAVAALVANGSRVCVLATSQAPQKVPGEQVFRLGPLAFPAVDDDAAVLGYGAVELFLERSRQADHRFKPAADELRAIAEICRRLDGIPLAIELAAARVGLLGVEGVRTRMNECFRLLKSGMCTPLPRHRTLRATFEWSYGLLPAAEQSVFDRLGVFCGGFSLQAAQRLCAEDDAGEWAVLDHLGALVDRSLVLAEPGTVSRYRLLEMGRAWALERLAESGATAAAMRRHAEVMIGLLENAYLAFRVQPVESAFGPLVADLDNLRSALAWCAGPDGDAALGSALCAHSLPLWVFVGQRAEGFQWSRRFVPHGDEVLSPLAAGRFWLGFADLGIQLGPPRELAAAARRAARCLELAGLPPGSARAMSLAAMCDAMAGDIPAADQALAEARRLHDPANPQRLDVLELLYGGLCLSYAGRLAQSRELLLRSVELLQRQGDRHLLFIALAALAAIAYAEDDALAALALVEPHIRESDANGAVGALTLLMRAVLPAALTALGRLDEAEEAFRAGIPFLRRAYGSPGGWLVDHLALYLAHRNRPADAARLMGYSDAYYSGGREIRNVAARRSRERVGELIGASLPAIRLERLRSQGRRASDEALLALALSR